MADAVAADVQGSQPFREQPEGSDAGSQAHSFAALPPDVLHYIFQLVFNAVGSSRAEAEEEAAAPLAVPLRLAVRQWFALRLTCCSWANVLQGVHVPLPPLEIWAASPACLDWLGRHGVRAVRFVRRAPQHLPDHPLPVDAPAPTHVGLAPFQPSDRRRDWQQQFSVGVDLSEWPRSPADDMLCRLDGVMAVGPHRASDQPMWSFQGWRRLQSLSVQASFTADSQLTFFLAPPSMSELRNLRQLELTGFGGYELSELPSTLRMLRLIQRQAGPGGSRLVFIPLVHIVSSNLQLNSCYFELLPASGEQLARQHGHQAIVDVELMRLRSRCRMLQVVAPQVNLDCACQRCVAYAMQLAAGSGDSPDAGSSEAAALQEGAAWQGQGGGGNPAVLPCPGERHDRCAQALLRAAYLLAAPGGILQRAELRSTALELAGASSGSPGAIVRGLSVARCHDNSDKTENLMLFSRWDVVTALKKTPAGADAVAGSRAGRGPFGIHFEHTRNVPTRLLLQRR